MANSTHMLSTDNALTCSQMTNTPEFDPVWIPLNHDFDYYAMFEVPQPWHKKVELGDTFPTSWNSALANLKNSGIKVKFLAVNPQNEAKENTKVFLYKNKKDSFIQLVPLIFDLPTLLVPDLLNGLAEDKLHEFNQYIETSSYRDIFVCIHANRDQCCGKAGHGLAENIRTLTNTMKDIRVWECSHMGGHRMAPVFMDMPSGNLWGFVKKDQLSNILFHSGDYQKVLRNFRGSMGSNKHSQIAEKELFYFWGWEWFTMRRKPGSIEEEGIKKKVSIPFEANSFVQTAQVTLVEDGVIFFPPSQCDDGKEIKKYFVESVDFVK